MQTPNTQIDRWQAVAQRAARDALLQPVRRDLVRAGLAPIVLKGDSLARVLYRSDPERRPHVDIDWLAPREELETVSTILLDHHWKPVPDSPGNYFQPGRISARVDLHSELWFVPESEWQAFDSRSVALEDLAPLRMPSLTDHFIIVAVHALLGHAHLRSTWTEDLTRLVLAGVEIEPTLERASRWGVEGPVRLAFEHVATSEGAEGAQGPVEKEPMGWFDRFREDLIRDLLSRPETPDVGHLLKWLYLPDLKSRLAALTRQLAPDRSFLASRYRDLPVSRSRLMRPVRTIAAGLRLGERLGSGRTHPS